MKKYVIFAGVNGAGKTTFYGTNPNISDLPRVNIDEIVRGFGSWKNGADVMKAGRIALKLIDEYFEKGISFNQETTLCGKNILKNIERAKTAGYEIELHYVGVDSPETAVKRVADRVAKGGHGIPEEDIRRRYYQSLENLEKVIPLCDRIKIYDNTDIFELIVSFVNGKCITRSRHIPEWCKGIIK